MDPSSAAAAYVLPDDADFDRCEQEEIAFGNFEVGEVDATTHLFSADAAFHTAPVMTCSNTPFTTVCTRQSSSSHHRDGPQQ
jgi:hypothetical protein